MNVTSVMTGNVWKVLVSVGSQVEKGQDVVILESMKMEIPVQSPESGTVKEILVDEGVFVEEGQVLLVIE
jgi:acetyl-CoA carboxylase biotin carboxyl carrier protein